MLDNTLIQPEAGLLKALLAAGMAGVQDGHIILFHHPVDCGEQAGEVFFCVNILFAMRGEQDIPALFKPQPLMDIAGLDLAQVGAQNLGHRRPGHIGALLGQAVIRQIAAGVLGIAEVDIKILMNFSFRVLCFSFGVIRILSS